MQTGDEVFRALSDPTRRAILMELRRGEVTPGELQPRFEISQPALSQHLRVLREAGLVRTRREGRLHYYTLEPRGLAPAVDWFAFFEGFWTERLDRLGDVLRRRAQRRKR